MWNEVKVTCGMGSFNPIQNEMKQKVRSEISVAVCCSVLQCVAVYGGVWQCVAMERRVRSEISSQEAGSLTVWCVPRMTAFTSWCKRL